MGNMRLVIWLAMMVVTVADEQNWSKWIDLEGKHILTEFVTTAAMVYDRWTYISVFTMSDKEQTDKFLLNCTRLADEMCEFHVANTNNTLENLEHQNQIHRSAFAVLQDGKMVGSSAQLEKTKDELEYGQNCRSAVASIRSLAARVIETGKKLKLIIKSYRVKRSINPLGALLKWAVGSMDHDDDVRITGMLDQVKRNENVTFHLAQKQTTILTSTMQKLLKPIRQLGEDYETLAQALTETREQSGKAMDATRRHEQMIETRTAMNAYLEAINLKVEEIADIRNEEIATIEAIMAKAFHHNMVDIDAFRNSYMAMVQSKDNTYLAVEEPPYTLVEIDTFVLGDDIYLKLTIPMASEELYEVKRVYPLPTPHDETFSKIPVVDAGWVANNVKTGRYIEWEDGKMNCKKVHWKDTQQLDICESNSMVKTGQPTECMDNLLGSLNAKCRSKLIQIPRVWVVKMEHPNRWLVMTKQTTTIRAVCRGEREARTMMINGVGTLEITQPCDIDIGNTKLMYRRNVEVVAPRIMAITSPTSLPITPDWDRVWIQEQTDKGSSTQLIKVNKHEEMTDEIMEAIKETEGLEQQWKVEDAIRISQQQSETVESHNWWIWSTLAAVILVFLGVVGVYIYTRMQTSSFDMAAKAMERLGKLALSDSNV